MNKFGKKILLLLLVFTVLLLPKTAGASLRVIPEAGTDAVHSAMVQKTVDWFNDILRQDMGVTLERDIRIFLCPTQDNYRQVLQRELGQSPELAARNAKVSGGFSSAKASAIALNLDLSAGGSAGSRAYKTTAHELFHQLQNQLAGANKNRAYYWMNEGTADLIGATVAEKMGYQSLDKWRMDQVNTLRKADHHAAPRALLDINLDQWTTLLETKQHPYEVADLMVLYLLQQAGPRGYRDIGDYYHRLGQGSSNEEAFRRAFGVEPVKLISGFQVWFRDLAASPATVDIIEYGSVPREWAQDVQTAVDGSRHLLQKIWGRDMISSLRLVLTADKNSYATAMVKEFGVSAEEAARYAKSTVWRYSGSTIIYDLGSLSVKSDRVYSVANAVLKKYINDRIPTAQPEQLLWLKKRFGRRAGRAGCRQQRCPDTGKLSGSLVGYAE